MQIMQQVCISRRKLLFWAIGQSQIALAQVSQVDKSSSNWTGL